MSTTINNVAPSLVLWQSVQAYGSYPNDFSNSDLPIGGIRTFATNYVDINSTALDTADGQLQAIQQNVNLFSLLGSNYGGDGRTNFALPDLSGRAAVGQGQGPGLNLMQLGEQGGSETSTLQQVNLPASSGGSSAPFSEDQPDLGLRYFIRVEGVTSTRSLTQSTIGTVVAIAGQNPATLGSYMACEGQILNVADHQALFDTIGATYGGDGINTFALPDLRGRTIVGAGQGPGLSDYALGDVVGAEGVTIRTANLPVAMGGSGVPIDNREPALALNYYIAVEGVFGSVLEGEQTIAEVIAFAGTLADPNGVILCNGALLSISQNTALFALIGTTFGGDGQTTFALPDLRGRSVLGQGDGYVMGQASGSEVTTLTLDNIPDLNITDPGFDVLYGANGNDVIRGLGGDDVIAGNGGIDRLLGGNGSDTLLGGEGNDFIYGGNGADNLDGGNGIDTLAYNTSAGGVTVNLGANTISGGDATGDTIANFENYLGGNGNDNVTGSAAANRLDGNGGNDVLAGLGGGDRLIGGAGIDTASYAGSAAGVTVDLSTTSGSGGDAEGDIYSSIENVVGSAHADVITGNAGANDLRGGGGDDIISGGNGADVIWGGNGADQLDGGDGIDTLVYSSTGGNITINLGANTITGGDATGDTITGFENFTSGGGNDSITGSNGVNVLIAGAGNDRIDGRHDLDVLTGGAGFDTFVLDRNTLSRDTITDFSVADDQLEVNAAYFTGGLVAGALSASQFLANATGLADTLEQRFILNTATGELSYDSNGSAFGGARVIAVFTGVIPVLTEADFLIV